MRRIDTAGSKKELEWDTKRKIREIIRIVLHWNLACIILNRIALEKVKSREGRVLSELHLTSDQLYPIQNLLLHYPHLNSVQVIPIEA